VTISRDNNDYVFAANLADIHSSGGCLAVQIENHTIAIFSFDSKIYAVDNRCPHMGFPLNRGTIKDGILTCHWHHARFDLRNGGTFDQWAGDVNSFPVQIRNRQEIWINISPFANSNPSNSQQQPHNLRQTLLHNGLKRNIPLMISKAVIALLVRNECDQLTKKEVVIGEKEDKEDKENGMHQAFRLGLDFGVHYKQSGWGQGLTVHTCMINILPYLDPENKAYALYHGLSAVAQDCASEPPRFEISPLPTPWPELSTLKRWFRQFIESRDAQAAERCVVTAIRSGADSRELADILFAAATDHRYLDVGHVLDFTNKAFEALDAAGWEKFAEPVLSSLILGYSNAERMEESNIWRHPIDLIAILEKAFKRLPSALDSGKSKRGKWNAADSLVTVLLSDDPQSIADGLLEALGKGCSEEQLARAVTYAASLRIAQFHTRNEFSDWDTALHTFTYANAVHQAISRMATPELLRGAFDAAMRVYLNRFLNVPAVQLPKPDRISEDPEILLNELPSLLDRQQQVNEAGKLVANYLYNKGDPKRLLASIGNLLLREDRNFHSIQMVEATFKQYSHIAEDNDIDDVQAIVNILVAAIRYLAAHAPTMRSQGRIYHVANQLYHGESLFEE
jgi:nitrite reductase/ring-hydroxylating ferredoxin subunit